MPDDGTDESRLDRADELSLPDGDTDDADDADKAPKKLDAKWYWIGGGLVFVVLLAFAVRYFTGKSSASTAASAAGTTPGGGAGGTTSAAGTTPGGGAGGTTS
ncbi:MAG: hypothetical protein ACYCSN_15415, partial [Acidobacteriaceae bacterium]